MSQSLTSFSSFKPSSCSVSRVRSLRKPATEVSLVQSFILILFCSFAQRFRLFKYLSNCYVILFISDRIIIIVNKALIIQYTVSSVNFQAIDTPTVEYSFCNCEFGVAGTKITASFPPRLYQLHFLPIFSCSRSSFVHSLGRCNGLSPS